MVPKAETTKSGDIPPAVLPGTPANDFPIKPEALIALAKKLFFEHESGVKDASLLADDFRFEFPVVSLPKHEYIKAVSGFKLKAAFPDLEPHAYDFRVDPYEPNRVWYTVRATGTHKGDLKFFTGTLKPTNKIYYGGPECCSYVFNAEGKCTSYTGGYVMDRRVGNTKGLGAMFGILAAIGGPVLHPGSPAYILLFARVLLSKAFEVLTLGLFKKKTE